LKKHRGDNAAEVNPWKNIAATMQRRSIHEETSWQQCSGGQSMEKHRGNNVTEANPWRNTSATMFPD
jgi:hypothetical protein